MPAAPDRGEVHSSLQPQIFWDVSRQPRHTPNPIASEQTSNAFFGTFPCELAVFVVLCTLWNGLREKPVLTMGHTWIFDFRHF